MRMVTIPGTDLSVSRFVFGTAGLFSVGAARQRRALLDHAVAAGFSHVDTAPYYGFGMAERDLQPILAAHPKVTVTTKVGLYSPGGELQSGLAILLRKAAGRALPALSRPMIDWSVARARASLDGSLRRLGRDRVDLLLLHEPRLDMLSTEEWLRWLQDETRTGRVRHFGIAPESGRLASFLPLTNPLCAVVQTNDSLERSEADLILRQGRPLQLTYGYVSSLRRGAASVDIDAVLGAALERNATGAIVVTTSRALRLAQYARLAGG